MPRLTRTEALSTLDRLGAESRTRDFHLLASEHKRELIQAARERGYRAPRNANGSKARYFHAYLIRAAGL